MCWGCISQGQLLWGVRSPRWAAPCSCHLRLRRPSSTEAGRRSLLLLLSPVLAQAKVTLVPPDGKMTAAAVITQARVKEHPALSGFSLLIFICPSFLLSSSQAAQMFFRSITWVSKTMMRRKRRRGQQPWHMSRDRSHLHGALTSVWPWRLPWG